MYDGINITVMVLASARTFVKDAQQMMAVQLYRQNYTAKRLHAGHQQPVIGGIEAHDSKVNVTSPDALRRTVVFS